MLPNDEQTTDPSPIVDQSGPITLVGGAAMSPELLQSCLRMAPRVVAVDGGADAALASGLQPLAVIGDFDSLSPSAADAFSAILHRIDEQDTTDFEKALTRVRAPLILAPGFLGGRLDHTLAALNVLVRHPSRPVVLVSDPDLAFVVSGTTHLTLAPGTLLSLLPMAPARVTTTGLRWNLSDQVLSPSGLVSSSNAVAERAVTITSDVPLVLTLPLSALASVTDVVRAK